jgi:hypothetical protein
VAAQQEWQMKPAAAFSIGLWTGAAVIAAVGLFTWQQFQRAHGSATSRSDSDLAAASGQVQLLQQENARLNAEVQRLKETAAALRSNLEERAVLETRRRVPFRVPSAEAETAPSPAGPGAWIEQAVIAGDVAALPELEKAAERNNHRALEAIALFADRDQAATLTRVWQSGTLTPSNQVDATRFFAATLEVNPEADQLLRALASYPHTDPGLLFAAVDGLANPSFRVGFRRDASIPLPPHFKPDYSARIRLLDSLRSLAADDSLRAYIEQAKAELQRAAESTPAAP